MFTGLIEHTGIISSSGPRPETPGGWGTGGIRLCVAAPSWPYRARRGDSVAVNGCCLTAVFDVGVDGIITFDAIPETLAKTTVGSLIAGDRVNLEHAATASTLLGGHIVQGHVDGVGRVISIDTDGQWRIRIGIDREHMPYMAPKGSICLDGVSLTIAAQNAAECWIEVTLIPTTLEKTTLGAWKPGTRVNVEADTMAKTIVNYLRHFAGPNAPQ